MQQIESIKKLSREHKITWDLLLPSTCIFTSYFFSTCRYVVHKIFLKSMLQRRIKIIIQKYLVKTKEDKNNKNDTYFNVRIWRKNANKSRNFFKPETDGASQTHISRVNKSNFWRKISWKQRRIKVIGMLRQKRFD